jgi:hypothetical protein
MAKFNNNNSSQGASKAESSKIIISLNPIPEFNRISDCLNFKTEEETKAKLISSIAGLPGTKLTYTFKRNNKNVEITHRVLVIATRIFVIRVGTTILKEKLIDFTELNFNGLVSLFKPNYPEHVLNTKDFDFLKTFQSQYLSILTNNSITVDDIVNSPDLTNISSLEFKEQDWKPVTTNFTLNEEKVTKFRVKVSCINSGNPFENKTDYDLWNALYSHGLIYQINPTTVKNVPVSEDTEDDYFKDLI